MKTENATHLRIANGKWHTKYKRQKPTNRHDDSESFRCLNVYDDMVGFNNFYKSCKEYGNERGCVHCTALRSFLLK